MSEASFRPPNPRKKENRKSNEEDSEESFEDLGDFPMDEPKEIVDN